MSWVYCNVFVSLWGVVGSEWLFFENSRSTLVVMGNLVEWRFSEEWRFTKKHRFKQIMPALFAMALAWWAPCMWRKLRRGGV